MIGQFQSICKVMFETKRGAVRPALRQPSARPFLRLVLGCVAMLMMLATPALAQDTPSGLPLPRFATTRSEPINVRVGPGTKYEIAWTFLKAGVPVEIVQEFDTWRKIRDVEGEEGWVHQNLLTGTRAGYVTPIMANQPIPLRSDPSDTARTNAMLGPGLRVSIQECDGDWCEVSASDGTQSGRPPTYSGFVPQEELWGVYPEEVFN